LALPENQKSFAVGDWLVQPNSNQISTTTESIYLRPQLMEVLVYLAGLNGEVASFDSIHNDLWSGKVVSSGTIYNCIADLRHALSKDGRNITYIETIPKKGYRLASNVTTLPALEQKQEQASVVVLPLNDRSGEVENEYLCDGIAEEIIHLLSKVNGLKLFSAITLKEEGLDPRVVGIRFSAQYVLTGSLQRSGNRLRLNFRLDDVSSGETAWSERYDVELTDVFELQDKVATQVVSALPPALNIGESAESLLEYSGTRNLDAFNAFLLGKHAYSKFSSQSLADAIRYFEQAVVLDSTFARAYYCLYPAYYFTYLQFGGGEEMLELARQAAANAKKYGFKPPVPWIHIERRLQGTTLPKTRDLALEALDKIKNPDPEWGSFGYEQLTWALGASGYFKTALDFARHMFDSPDQNYEDSDANEELPYYYAAVGQFDEAIFLLSSEIQKDPARPVFRVERSILYSRTGQLEYAEQDINTLESGRAKNLALAFNYFWRDEPERVIEYRNRLLEIHDLPPSYQLWASCMTGDLDAAIENMGNTVHSVLHSYIDFGVYRVMMRARLPMSFVEQFEQHPGFQLHLKREGIDDAWRKELMERVNELSDITGISIHPDDDQIKE
jgi:TolB-like protein